MPAKSKRTKQPEVWIVTHVEIMGCTKHPQLDTMTFHAASTRSAALAYVRDTGVNAWSWWELLAFEIDAGSRERDDASATTVLYADAKGRVVRDPKLELALAAFVEHRKQELEQGLLTAADDRCAFCKKASKRPRRTRA